jgi:hypothetical protein
MADEIEKAMRNLFRQLRQYRVPMARRRRAWIKELCPDNARRISYGN